MVFDAAANVDKTAARRAIVCNRIKVEAIASQGKRL